MRSAEIARKVAEMGLKFEHGSKPIRTAQSVTRNDSTCVAECGIKMPTVASTRR